MADTRQELEAAVFDLAARVASVRAALSTAERCLPGRAARRAGGLLPRARRCDGLDGVGAVRPGRDGRRDGPGGTGLKPAPESGLPVRPSA